MNTYGQHAGNVSQFKECSQAHEGIAAYDLTGREASGSGPSENREWHSVVASHASGGDLFVG